MTDSTTSVFLFCGMDNARRATAGQEWSEALFGLCGVVELCARRAPALNKWYDENIPGDCPGVFDYDVTEAMGDWMFHNPSRGEGEFLEGLERFVVDWFDKNGDKPWERPAWSWGYEVNPTRLTDGDIEVCEPEEAEKWSVYRRPLRPWHSFNPAEWLADFRFEEDATAFQVSKRVAKPDLT
jgi:hypothetical protein